MNSVALPASATAGALGAEVDLIRQAARGDEESFGELYRRHSQTAWRLAQAVAVDRDGAIGAVAEGFGRSLRNLRRQSRLDPEAYRPLLLAAVYKAALDHVHSHSMPTPTFAARSVPKGKGAHAKGANAALLEAAFRSLPERWRAAVWLGDAESMEPERIAAALGVSSAVASQLLTRGRRGLAGRFVQAHRPEPEHLGSALRPLAAAIPANLADETAARWKALVTDASARFAPLTGWMNERAVRPLWVSVGALMGLGLIGLGIVGQTSTVNNGGVATSKLPAANAAGVNPFATNGGPGGLIGGVGTVAPNGGLNPFFAGGGPGGSGSGSTSFGTTPLGPTYPGSNTPTNNLPPGGGTGGTGGGGGGAGGGGQTQGSQVLNSPVLSVTNSGGLGGTTNLNVNSNQTGTVGTVTVTPSPTGCTGLTTKVTGTIGCTTTAPAPAPSNTVSPGTPPTGSSSTTSPLSNTLSTTTKTVTNTLSTTTSGL